MGKVRISGAFCNVLIELKRTSVKVYGTCSFGEMIAATEEVTTTRLTVGLYDDMLVQ